MLPVSLKLYLRNRLRKLSLTTFTKAIVVAVLLLVTLYLYSLLSRQELTSSPYLQLPKPTGENGPVFQEDLCEMCDSSLPVKKEDLPDVKVIRHLRQEAMPLYRHYSGHEPWPELQLDLSLPGQSPSTVHYLWCKDTVFGFHHYLGILSALRHLQPIKVIFHYKLLPLLDPDMYYTWFLELKQSLPNLVFRPFPEKSPPCGTRQMLDLAISFLQEDGGVLLGSNVILSRMPRDIERRLFWFATASPPPIDGGAVTEDVTRIIAYANKDFNESTRQMYVQRILKSKGTCVSIKVFDLDAADSAENAHCISFQDKPDLYPVDIMYAANSSFAQLARWLFYGTRALMYPKTKIGKPIPRISHLIWFSPSRKYLYDMEFYQFLTILSALYVGGFHHVYIHGNAGFKGRWWKELKNENVTFIRIQKPEMVYQQAVKNPSHESDVSRYNILHKYGGAYHDFEAMWTNYVPDWLLDYPCVATSDWVAYGDFPDGINPGVILAKPRAPWIRYNLQAHRYYVEENFVWNAVLMSYRTYERHPNQLLYYRHLQVMCDYGICHPTWEPGFRRDIENRKPTISFDWQKDTLVVHVTRPDPERSLISPDTVKHGNDMFAKIARNILTKSGRLDLMPK